MPAELTRVSTTMRDDEVVTIDEWAATFATPYEGNRASALRVLIRYGLDNFDAVKAELDAQHVEQNGSGRRPCGCGDNG